MAELVVYDYVGPGEQETAETLAKALPDDWLIIAGRALPTPQKDDVDLLVVGEQPHLRPGAEALGPGGGGRERRLAGQGRAAAEPDRP